MSSCTIRPSSPACAPFPYKEESLQNQATPASFNRISSALNDLKHSLPTARPDDVSNVVVMRQVLQSLLVGYADHRCDPHFERNWDHGDVSASVDDMIKAVNDPDAPLRKALTEKEVDEVLCAIETYQSLIHTPALQQSAVNPLLHLSSLRAENFNIGD